MKRSIILIISACLLFTVSAEGKSKKKGGNKSRTTTAKVSAIVKEIGEGNDGTLLNNQKALSETSEGSQFDKWKNPFKMKVDPKLLNHGKKKKKNKRNRKRR